MKTSNIAPTSMVDPDQIPIEPIPIPIQGFFTNYAQAMDDYAKVFTFVGIDSVEVVTGKGPDINEDEVVRFKVRVTNIGHLNLTNVRLHIVGLNGAEVSEDAAGPWVDDVYSTGRSVDAHDSKGGRYFYFKVPESQSTTDEVTLVRANFSGFDANINHLMNDHTVWSDPPAGTYSTVVYPA